MLGGFLLGATQMRSIGTEKKQKAIEEYEREQGVKVDPEEVLFIADEIYH
jgi:hypothetical protein